MLLRPDWFPDCSPRSAESSTCVVDFVVADPVVQEATKPSREQVGRGRGAPPARPGRGVVFVTTASRWHGRRL